MLVQRRRDKRAALRLLRKLLRKQGFTPSMLVIDKLGSYGAAFRALGLSCPHRQGLRANNRAENSHQTVRNASARCSGSNRPARPSDFSACMPPSTTPSISSGTSSPERPCRPSEPKQQLSGSRPSPTDERRAWTDLALLSIVYVTMPARRSPRAEGHKAPTSPRRAAWPPGSGRYSAVYRRLKKPLPPIRSPRRRGRGSIAAR